MLMINQPQFIYDVVAMTLLATLGMLFFGLFLVKPLLAIIRIPSAILMPLIMVLCTVGAFAIASRLFDVYVMLFIGVCAFVLRRLNYPIPPFVLGIVLGDILDKSLRRGLTLSNGDLSPFVTRPDLRPAGGGDGVHHADTCPRSTAAQGRHGQGLERAEIGGGR